MPVTRHNGDDFFDAAYGGGGAGLGAGGGLGAGHGFAFGHGFGAGGGIGAGSGFGGGRSRIDTAEITTHFI